MKVRLGETVQLYPYGSASFKSQGKLHLESSCSKFPYSGGGGEETYFTLIVLLPPLLPFPSLILPLFFFSWPLFFPPPHTRPWCGGAIRVHLKLPSMPSLEIASHNALATLIRDLMLTYTYKRSTRHRTSSSAEKLKRY